MTDAEADDWRQDEAATAELLRLVCSPNDLVLDPFCGSGTTGAACLAVGCRFLGIDSDPSAIKIAADRLQKLSLFVGGCRTTYRSDVEQRGESDPKGRRAVPNATNSIRVEPSAVEAISSDADPPAVVPKAVITSTHVHGAASPEEEGSDRLKEIPAAILKVGLAMVSKVLAGLESHQPRLLQLFDTTRTEWAKGEGTLFATDAMRGVWFHSTALIGFGFRLHAEDVPKALKFVGEARAIRVSSTSATTLVSDTGAEFVGRACAPYPKYMGLRHDSHLLRIPGDNSSTLSWKQGSVCRRTGQPFAWSSTLRTALSGSSWITRASSGGATKCRSRGWETGCRSSH